MLAKSTYIDNTDEGRWLQGRPLRAKPNRLGKCGGIVGVQKLGPPLGSARFFHGQGVQNEHRPDRN
jgi:hypothetical protein